MKLASVFMRDHAVDHSDYFGALTGLRGFAALWVFLYHAWVYAEPRLMMVRLGDWSADWTPLFSMGWAGVDFFFVLSAFLLSLPFAHWACGERPYPAPGRYMLKRFKRIFPAYWFQLVILLAIAFGTSFYAFPSLKSLAGHAVMYFNLPPAWISPLNLVWWTLPTEFIFYLLLLPLSLLLKSRGTRLLMVALIGGAWLYRWWVFDQFQAYGMGRLVTLMGNTLGYLDLFVIGDIRDLVVQGGRELNDGSGDDLILALSAVGLATTRSNSRSMVRVSSDSHSRTQGSAVAMVTRFPETSTGRMLKRAA